MGPAGSGKTRFINDLTGTTLAEGAMSVEACTKEIEFVPLELDGQAVVLIDTPGLDAEEHSAASRKIIQYLRLMYKEGNELTGIVYMHRITDNRISAIAIQNFASFHNMCGEDAMQNVAIVTNLWTLVRREVGEARERELTSTCYKSAIDQGAKILRNDGAVDSAKRILRDLLNNDEVVLQCQGSPPSQTNNSVIKKPHRHHFSLSGGNLSAARCLPKFWVGSSSSNNKSKHSLR